MDGARLRAERDPWTGPRTRYAANAASPCIRSGAIARYHLIFACAEARPQKTGPIYRSGVREPTGWARRHVCPGHVGPSLARPLSEARALARRRGHQPVSQIAATSATSACARCATDGEPADAALELPIPLTNQQVKSLSG